MKRSVVVELLQRAAVLSKVAQWIWQETSSVGVDKNNRHVVVESTFLKTIKNLETDVLTVESGLACVLDELTQLLARHTRRPC